MIGRTTQAMWGMAHLMLSPGYLIDKFLDWLDELSATLVPVRLDHIACNQMRTEALHEPFRA